MAIIADAGGIYGLYDRSDKYHARISAAVKGERDRILIPSAVLGEIDYLLRVRLGTPALVRFLSDIRIGAFELEPITGGDVDRCISLISKYSNLDLGLSDASVIALAERVGANSILTVDERDFRVIRSTRNKPFRLLPADYNV